MKKMPGHLLLLRVQSHFVRTIDLNASSRQSFPPKLPVDHAMDHQANALSPGDSDASGTTIDSTLGSAAAVSRRTANREAADS